MCWFQSTAGLVFELFCVCVCAFDLFLGVLGRTAGYQEEEEEGYLQRADRPKVPPAVVPSKWMSFTQESAVQSSAISQC